MIPRQIVVDNQIAKLQVYGRIKSHFNLRDGFDGIVGNPPYVNTFLLERILTKNPTYKEDIKANLVSAKGAFDICSLFVEVARKIGPKARIGYILPNKLVAVDSAKGMREFIKDDPSTFLESVDDVSSHAFNGWRCPC